MNDTYETSDGRAGAVELTPGQIDYRRQELRDLSRLNNAMFSWVCNDNLATTSFLSAIFDKTTPDADQCQATRPWDLTIQGDFYLLQRLGRFIYIVVGDAAGHHAHAGALKVFVAAALKQIFDGTSLFRTLTAETVLHELRYRFVEVGRVALKDEGAPLSGGANVIVVRIDIRKSAITYASAGLPVFAIGSDWSFDQCGRYSEEKGVRFPRSLEEPSDFTPHSGTVRSENTSYLAFVTDGFRTLKRLEYNGAEVSEPFFNDDHVKAALLATVGPEELRPTPQQMAESLVAAARGFRKGYMIPEDRDDDRLVVIVDVGQARATPPKQSRAARFRHMANSISSLGRKRFPSSTS